jgi:hypothetical protein
VLRLASRPGADKCDRTQRTKSGTAEGNTAAYQLLRPALRRAHPEPRAGKSMGAGMLFHECS